MKHEEMTNSEMKAALKARINEALTGEIVDSQMKSLNNAMLNQIKFAKHEMDYKKLTHSKKELAIYE